MLATVARYCSPHHLQLNVSARLPLPLAAGYTYMRWFHKPSGRLMVATPTLRDELVEHGFRNVSPWTRGVDTEQRVFQALSDRYGKPAQEGKAPLKLRSGKTVESLRARWPGWTVLTSSLSHGRGTSRI